MTKVEHDLVCVAPKLIVERSKTRVIIEANLVEFPAGAGLGQPTEKLVHLGMLAEDAMKLLAHLKAVQRLYGWADAPESLAVKPTPSGSTN